MPKMCEVPRCKEIGAHQFPRDPAIRKLWLKAIRRSNFKPLHNSRLCRKHFLKTDFQKTSFYTGVEHQHHFLNKDAVPSVFPWTHKVPSKEAQAREQRLISRNNRNASSTSDIATIYILEDNILEDNIQDYIQDNILEDNILEDNILEDNILEDNIQDNILEDNIQDNILEDNIQDNILEDNILEDNILEDNIQDKPCKEQKSCGTQTSGILSMSLCELLLTDDESVMFHTGLETYAKFDMFLSTLLPMANNLTYRWSQDISVPVEDQFLILLIKLRRNKTDFELAKMFNISKAEITNIIVTWINFVNDLWSLIDIWPSRDLVDYYMPDIFKNESNRTRVVVDATEVQRVHIERLVGKTKTYKILQTRLVSFYIPLASRIYFICFMLCNLKDCILNINEEM